MARGAQVDLSRGHGDALGACVSLRVLRAACARGVDTLCARYYLASMLSTVLTQISSLAGMSANAARLGAESRRAQHRVSPRRLAVLAARMTAVLTLAITLLFPWPLLFPVAAVEWAEVKEQLVPKGERTSEMFRYVHSTTGDDLVFLRFAQGPKFFGCVVRREARSVAPAPSIIPRAPPAPGDTPTAETASAAGDTVDTACGAGSFADATVLCWPRAKREVVWVSCDGGNIVDIEADRRALYSATIC